MRIAHLLRAAREVMARRGSAEEALWAVWSASNGRGGSSAKPWRRVISATNHSSPRESIVYLSRACLRTARLPKSRCVVTTASATASSCSGRRKPTTSAIRG